MGTKDFTDVTQWISEIMLILLFPLISLLRFFIPLNTVKNQHSKKIPIVIIEQWFARTISHMFLKRFLEERNFQVYVFTYSSLNGGIDDGAYHLSQFMNNRHINQCVLVGVSMGALTSFVYAQRFGGWEKVRKMFCLAGPFRGTPWASSIAFLKSGRQLVPQSPFIKQLEKEKIFAPHRLVCITAKRDEFVPKWSSYLTQARNEEVPIVGHNNLHIWSRDVWEMVVREAEKK